MRIGILHCCRKLEAVRREYTVVVIAGKNEGRGVVDVGPHIVIRRIREHRLEVVRVVDRAVVGLPALRPTVNSRNRSMSMTPTCAMTAAK